MAGLVGDPLFVDRLVDPRQDAHHLAPTGVDADGRADRVHDVDRFGLGQLPGAGVVGVGLRGQRADGAEIGHTGLEFRAHRLFEIGGDLHVLAAADGAEIRHAGDLAGEADAARAMDAAVHPCLHQRADVLVLDGALVLVEAGRIDPVGHGLVLQVALAALVADRAIERVVDEQELHHPLARLLHQWRLGDHRRRLTVGARAAILDAPGAGRHGLGRALQFDEAHAAIAGDRQPLVEAEARNLRAGRLAGLEQRVPGRDVDLDVVDDDPRHALVLISIPFTP